MSQKKITLMGPFDDEDMKAIMETLRICEQKQPNEKFLMAIEANDSRPVEDIKEFLKESFPAVKGVPVTLETFKK